MLTLETIPQRPSGKASVLAVACGLVDQVFCSQACSLELPELAGPLPAVLCTSQLYGMCHSLSAVPL